MFKLLLVYFVTRQAGLLFASSAAFSRTLIFFSPTGPGKRFSTAFLRDSSFISPVAAEKAPSIAVLARSALPRNSVARREAGMVRTLTPARRPNSEGARSSLTMTRPFGFRPVVTSDS